MSFSRLAELERENVDLQEQVLRLTRQLTLVRRQSQAADTVKDPQNVEEPNLSKRTEELKNLEIQVGRAIDELRRFRKVSVKNDSPLRKPKIHAEMSVVPTENDSRKADPAKKSAPTIPTSGAHSFDLDELLS